MGRIALALRWIVKNQTWQTFVPVLLASVDWVHGLRFVSLLRFVPWEVLQDGPCGIDPPIARYRRSLPMSVHNSDYSLSNRHNLLSGGRLRFDCTNVSGSLVTPDTHTVVKLVN